LWIGKLTPNDPAVYAVRGTTDTHFSNVPIVPGAAVFVVLKLEFNVDPSAKDTVSVYFNPTPGLAAPDVAPIVITDSNFPGGISSVAFFAANHTAFSFDEIRFGDGYADVAPGSPFGWFDLGHAKPGTSGTPHLSGTGTLAGGSSNQLDLVNAKPVTLCTLAVG